MIIGITVQQYNTIFSICAHLPSHLAGRLKECILQRDLDGVVDGKAIKRRLRLRYGAACARLW